MKEALRELGAGTAKGAFCWTQLQDRGGHGGGPSWTRRLGNYDTWEVE